MFKILLLKLLVTAVIALYIPIHLCRQWIKSAVTLTVIMGLTWIIGVLIFHRSLVSLAYIFTIAIAFQVNTVI